MLSDTFSPALISKFPKVVARALLSCLLVSSNLTFPVFRNDYVNAAFAHEEDDKNHDDGDRKHRDKILLKNISDAPDPFSAGVAGSVVFQSRFAVRKTDGLGDEAAEGRKKRFFIEQTLRITDAATGTEQVTLKGETEVLPVAHQDEDDDGEDDDQIIPVSVQQLWDGRDAQGAIVSDGIYNYEVKGTLVRVKNKTPEGDEDDEKIKVIDISNVLTGAITVDNTAPVISDVTPADGSTTTDSRPTISAAYSDQVSGIDLNSVLLKLDGADVTARASVSASSVSFTPSVDLSTQTHLVEIQVKDNAGNTATVVGTFTVLPVHAPPVLAPVGDHSVPLGSALTIELMATDANDDPLTFFVSPLPLPANAVFNAATGFFSFKPAADQAGIFPFTFSVSDGALTDSETINIFVEEPSPGALTALSGRVLDTNSFVGGLEVPVVGAVISLLGTGFSAVTDAAGRFTLTGIPGGSHIFDINPATANLAPDGSSYAGFREEIDLIDGVNNIIDRPFFIPRIARESLTTVDPNTTTMVTNPTLGVTIEVPPHTAKNPDGSDFAGELSISEVPEGLAPAAMPENLKPGLLITIQPVGVRFAVPAAITFPNIDNLSAGSQVDIWSLDPNAGVFVVVGVGRVSTDGSVIETISGGVRAADWHMAMPPGGSPAETGANSENADQTKCCKAQTSSQTALSSGDLTEDHTLVSHRAQGQSRRLRLVYHSLRADPKPVIESNLTIPVRAAVPPMVSTRLSVAGVDQGTGVFTDTSGLSENIDETIRQVVQFDAGSLPTGRYPYQINISSHYTQSSVVSSLNGTVVINNQIGSPYGAGWTMEGVSRIFPQNDGRVVLSEGDGSTFVFTPQSTFRGSLAVDAKSNIYLAGSGGVLPPGFSFPSGPGQVLTFDNVTGSVNCCLGSFGFNGSDGGNLFAPTNISSLNGISGIIHPRTLFLAGVFLDDTTPAAPAPAVLNYFSLPESSLDFFPELRQTFFIGDGLTGTGAGAIQQFHAPGGATRLFLGLIDGAGFKGVPGAYGDNLGSFNASFEISQPASVINFFQSPAGDFSTLAKNPDGTLTRALKDGTKINFDTAGLQTSVIDRNGNTTGYSYDGQGRLATITDPAGLVTTLTYGADGLLERVNDPAARATIFGHDLNGNLTRVADPDGSQRLFTYDSRHRLIGQTDKRGNTSTYDYNFAGRNIKANRPDGSTRQVTPAQTVGLVDLASGVGTQVNPAPVTRPAAAVSTFTDGNGNVTTLATDSFGAATATTDALGRTTSIARDADSNPTQITRPNGAVTTMAYDTKGNLLTSTDQSIGAATTFTYEPNFNQVTSIKDPKLNTTTISYDTFGNPVTIKDALNNQTTLGYNSRGLLTQVTDASGSATQFTYNAAGNLATTTDPLNHVTTLDYDTAGNVIRSTDAKGNVTSFTYDTMNRLIRMVDAAGGTTSYTYDAAGNLTRVTDARGGVTAFEYDSQNRLVKTIDPLGKFETFNYDANGNLIQTIDRKVQTINFAYDVVNQLIRKTLPGDAVTGDLVTTYQYNSAGDLVTVNDPDSALSFTYDGASRLISATDHHTLAPNPLTLTYTYDKNGNRLMMADSVTGATNYTYDALNRLSILDPPSSNPINFTYDVLSRRISSTLPNGVTTNYTYDAASQLLSLSHQLSAVPFTSFNYTYDQIGNRTSKTQNSITSNYTYDALSRLISATNPTENYAYDPVGNRNPLTQSYNNTNQLLDDGTFTYTYDDNGNTTSKTNKTTLETTTYTYDAENQLIQIKTNGVTTATYLYDGLGRRIEKSVVGNITRYIYDNEDILLEYNGTNTLQARYTHGAGIDEPLIMERGGQSYFYHADGLGSITDLTSSTGAVAQSYVYDSFGNIVTQVGSLANPYTYTGREFDSESGLYHYRFRYYDSRIGRFLQEDPTGLTGGDLNYYAYTFNDPVNLTDSTGLWFGFDDVLTGPFDEAIVIGGLGLAAYLGVEGARDTLNQLAQQASVLFTKSGSQKGVGKNFKRAAQHLANLSGSTVGGTPPNKPKDPKNFNHWKTEIKAFIDNIKKAKLSSKQLLQELKKQTNFTEDQIQEILRKIAESGFDDICPL